MDRHANPREAAPAFEESDNVGRDVHAQRLGQHQLRGLEAEDLALPFSQRSCGSQSEGST